MLFQSITTTVKFSLFKSIVPIFFMLVHLPSLSKHMSAFCTVKRYKGGTHGITIIIVENKIGDLSTNPRQGCYRFAFVLMPLGKA